MADVVVVGGGVAGCVAARTMADSGVNVLLLEAGLADVPLELRSADWLGQADGTPWLWQSELLVPGEYLRGRGLGGGSAINGMVSAADTPDFYDQWPNGWRHKELGRYLEQVRAKMSPKLASPGRLSQAINRSEGWVPLELFLNSEGQRRTFADVYLAEPPSNLTVRSEVEVELVLTEGRQVVGVELVSGERISCGAVVLCAGTFGTAELLHRSGIDLNPKPVQDHKSKAITLDLAEQFRTHEPGLSPGSTRIEGYGFEILVLDHLGGDRTQGAVMVAETEHAGLQRGVRRMQEIVDELKAGGVATRRFESPGGYYHAASTLPGGTVVDRSGAPEGWGRLHIMDASVMPSLVRCSPSLTIAATAALMASRLSQ